MLETRFNRLTGFFLAFPGTANGNNYSNKYD